MKPDLHCHSNVSDGSLAPAAVVERAAARGVDLLALTDHDETDGVAEAAARAGELGIRLLPGVEVSASWQGHSVHVVGLGVDVAAPALVAGLRLQRAGRQTRAVEMAAALQRIGIAGALAGARCFAANPELIGRAHFARHLVACGLVKDVQTAFQHYLKPGRPGFVPQHWAALAEAVAWIRGAGGVAVLAHPGRYRISHAELETLCAEFAAAGGEAIEVSSGAPNAGRLQDAAALARRFGLLASCGSDFHDPDESPCDLGACQRLPDALLPVWSRFPAAVTAAGTP